MNQIRFSALYALNLTGVQFAALIAPANLVNFTISEGSYDAAVTVTANRALTSAEITTLLGILPGGAAVWTITNLS